MLFLVAVYGLFAFVAVGNLLLMPRPRGHLNGSPRKGEDAPGGDGTSPPPTLRFLIPARDEAANLAELLPLLTPQGPVTVFDDESSDGTGEVAAGLGATVLRPAEPLPPGWTGKNRACHELAHSAFDEPFFLFLDADVRVGPEFGEIVRRMARAGRVGTAFPRSVGGRFPEPLVLGWVGWSLLALDPFFLVARTGRGHARFTNGQMTLWPAELYRRLRPNESVRDRILEDVLIGRLLAKEKVPVDVVNLSGAMSVRMYRTWREALDGMSKNSVEIAPSAFGAFLLAGLLFAIAWAWLLSPLFAGGLFLLSSLAVGRTVRANPFLAPLMPISLTIGAFTIMRSWWWRRTGRTRWKGRTYP